MILTTHNIDAALRRLEPYETEALATDPQSMAKLLGIGVSTLDRLRKAKKIPYMKIGNRTIYPIADVRQWLSEKSKVNQ